LRKDRLVLEDDAGLVDRHPHGVFCYKHEDVQQLIKGEVGALPKHGEIGRGRVDNINPKTRGGTSPTYLLRRLKRDFPAF
jgi:hypothetical protein